MDVFKKQFIIVKQDGMGADGGFYDFRRIQAFVIDTQACSVRQGYIYRRFFDNWSGHRK
jgi:hypothetical protein